MFAERLGADSTRLSPSYPGDGSGGPACDVAAMLESRVVNRGALNLFTNRTADARDVERVDYLFDSGLLAPLTPEGLAGAGHIVSEKDGNNRLKIAAVLSLDVFGRPASYGPLVLVQEIGCMDPELCYGLTDVTHDYAFFGSDSLTADGYPAEEERSTETVSMAFVSSERLGLEPGRRYFGFSLFADDVDTDEHDPLDPGTFPDDTEDAHLVPGDSADVYGGLGGWFIDDALSVGSGRVFLDENGDGLPGDDEAGIADIGIELYRDTDGDGVLDPGRDEPLGNAIDTDRSGLFVLPGLPDGQYIAVLREDDPELPAGLELAAGGNPRPFAISGGDVDTLDFAFTDGGGAGGGNAGAGGDDAGGTTAGGDDGGGATAGGDDAGNADAGGDDAGGATAGGDDAGNTDAGGDDAGGATAGGDDAGNTDAGGDDAGGATAGGDDAGNTDAGGDDAGGATAGGDDAGNTDAGGDDAGGATAGGDDAGNTDAGGDDAGNTDAGGDDAGGATAGGDDAGNTDAGGDDAGNTDAGGDDAGGATAGGDDAGNTDAGGDDAGGATAGGDDAGNTDAGGDDGGLTPTDPDPGASRDDAVTRAEADRFPVVQSVPTELDVLANDSDGAGEGLTIIRVAEPPNGTAEIVDGPNGRQEILYTSDVGYFGDDVFVYEIRDGDGSGTSGTVTANVLRSDINGNGTDDFIECGCTDLTLETGVHGSGVGRASFALLALVAGGALLRRRRVGASDGRRAFDRVAVGEKGR